MVGRIFLSTPSARRATAGIRRAWRRIPISIHALREEGDGTHGPHRRERPNFYPRPPRGGRPATTHTAASPVFYFYPRPPRGGRLRGEMGNLTPGTISIHALREEGDGRFGFSEYGVVFISIHALREEGDTKLKYEDLMYRISIHALREEGDVSRTWKRIARNRFLSTPSARRATGKRAAIPEYYWNFYPRPPRGGRPGTTDKPAPYEDFYPRPPRGGRHKHLERRLRASQFLSTPSARRATYRLVRLAKFDEFLSTPSARRATISKSSGRYA